MSTRSEFTKYLKSMDEEELRKELQGLFKRFRDVKLHYTMELGGDAERKKVFDKAKKDIRNMYFIKNKPRKRPRVAKSKQILKELDSVSVFTHELVDLYLYVTEVSMDYLMRRYRSTASAYNSCKDAFAKAINLIAKTALHDEFKKRCGMLAQLAMEIPEMDSAINNLYREQFKA